MATQQKIGSHCTTVRQTAGVLSVVYHATEVVRAAADRITLDSGGYRTATTKTRMNQASNQYDLCFSVFQRGGTWFVRYKAEAVARLFVDGMEIAR